MAEILLVGTFHFMASSIDFYSSKIQTEVDTLVRKMSAFCPDVIAVEAAVSAQKSVDLAYNKLKLADFQDSNKMRTETLGEICMFGQKHPITYNNEAIQIGLRLGKLLNHDKVYAIDDDTFLNMDVMQEPSTLLKEAKDAFSVYKNTQTSEAISELYKHYNSEEWSRLNHNVYIQANMLSTNNYYAGAEMVSKWYERNLKIFSNIQRLAVDHKRIFIIYGAGHLQILRDLINADSNLKLIDVNGYL